MTLRIELIRTLLTVAPAVDSLTGILCEHREYTETISSTRQTVVIEEIQQLPPLYVFLVSAQQQINKDVYYQRR